MLSDRTEMAPAPLKAICNRLHAKRRADERFAELGVTAETIAGIEARIAANDPTCVQLRPDNHFKNRAFYAVKVGDRWLPAIYDLATRSIVTFPPEHALLRYKEAYDPTPKSQPAPPTVPFVGKILGRVSLPPPPAPRPLKPNEMAMPATEKEAEARLAELNEEIRRLAAEQFGRQGGQQTLANQKRIEALSSIRRKVKKAHHTFQAERVLREAQERPLKIREVPVPADLERFDLDMAEMLRPFDEEYAASAARTLVLQGEMSATLLVSRRQGIAQQLAAEALSRREIKKRKNAAQMAFNLERSGIQDVGSSLELLKAASFAMTAMFRRLALAIDPQHAALKSVIIDHIRAREARPAAEEEAR